jgi:hypothetical protein
MLRTTAFKDIKNRLTVEKLDYTTSLSGWEFRKNSYIVLRKWIDKTVDNEVLLTVK